MSTQLHIQKHGGVLEATYRWRNPTAYFLAFFCLFWDGFLILWYSLAISEGDSAALLFPLIHVAVGIGLTYYTLCLLFNTSEIRVDRSRLTIEHGPFPWWGGDLDIPVDSIQQLFVKEQRRSNKGRVNYSYGIRIVRTNGQAATLFNIFTPNSEDMRRLERAIEEQLRIADQPVPGEFRPDSASDSSPVVVPRRIEPPAIPHQPHIGHARREDFVTLRGKDYAVVQHIQFDWNNGRTDLLLHLSGPTGEIALYIERSATTPRVYESRQLDAGEQARLPLTPEAPPETFDNGEDAYRLTIHSRGYFFPEHLRQQGGISVEQWVYVAESAPRFRFVHYQGMTELYIEAALEPTTDIRVLKAG